MLSPIVPSEALDKRVLEYVLMVTERAKSWWTHPVEGTERNRHDELQDYRLRMEGRRSVAELYHDAKSEPFDGASNVGVGIESIFAEFLIPLLIANTHDLEPKLQARLAGTKELVDDLTTFHDAYHHYEVPDKRELVEYSTRELLTVGSCFHKWSYGRWWTQSEVDFPVWINPLDGQPMLTQDPGTGRMLPRPADPKTPNELIPVDPASGLPMKLSNLKATQPHLKREGLELSVRPVESIGFPERETRLDPDQWDWLSDDFEVSAYWLLGREGDPFEGKYRLTKLWHSLGLDPNTLHADPLKLAMGLKPIKLRAFYGKYPAAADGSPVEITALIATENKIMLGWRPSLFPRRPYFNRQVWHSGTSPIGKGIPETVFSLRSAMDALLNQEIDSGNLYNHPPLLLSDLAMLEDEDYETTGPGATWIMRDINGAKFLPTPIGQRHPVELLNWLMSNTQRIWGVTDLNLSAPTSSLSPNVTTARGTIAILNQGSIKFGHLTKRLSALDTREFQYVHDAFRLMLANRLLVTVDGKPHLLDPTQREQYFSEQIQVVAAGNGISTNPILRQQTLAQLLEVAANTQNPFLVGDLDAYKQLTEQYVSSLGLQIKLKDPKALEQSRLFLELMQTPEGQAVLPQVMQRIIQAIQAKQATAEASRNGGTNGSPQPVAAFR